MDNRDSAPNGVAIVGMAGRFPGALDVERFWKNLVAGVESIRFFSAEELRAVGVEAELLADPAFVRARAVISDAELFDAGLFGLTPREAEVIDPQHRLLLECAWEALENAGHDPRRFPGTVGVFAGAGVNTYLLANLQHNREVMGAVGSFQAMVGSGGDFLATRISYKLGLTGPSLTVQTACSTSLVAVHLAVQSLLAGECDLALAGGVRMLVPRQGGHTYQPGSIFSQDGHCRPFDAAATGTTEGEGLGLVVLRRLADAVEDGDHVHAVLLGSAINNDGAEKLGYTVPSVEGQAGVIALAQALAGVEAGTIGLIEAHGTGTPLGDPIEVAALSQVFSMSAASAASAASATPDRRVALGSLKSNLGHLDAAAGVASLIKAALAVEHGIIPPSLHFARPNPQLDLAAGGFYVPVTATSWVEESGPRRAGVSSFGIGGTNAHVVLEEAPAMAPGSASRPLQLLVLSARTPAALEQATRRLAEHLGSHPELDIADVAHTLQVGRVAFDPRRIVVCASTADAAAVLSTLDPKRVLTRTREAGERPVFFLFSGQGAQYPGMGAELYAGEAVFRAEVDRCAEILRPRLGLDLRQALYPQDVDPQAAAERLAQTALAQPALFVVEYALARLWMAWGVRPEAMLGHSIGEYVAACLAGVFSLPDALGLVAERGRLMQEMPDGSMLAVPLPEAEVRPLLGGLSLAAVNGPAMCVVAGEPGEVATLSEQLTGRGLAVRRLRTSHAFHSASMEPVLAPFAAAFAGLRLRPPSIPFVSNRTGTWIRPEEATSPAYWVGHLRETVRFAAGLSVLLGRPGAVFLEVGPGRALTTLVRQHPERPEAPSVLSSLPTSGDGRTADAAVLRTLGQLWLAGVEIDWAGCHAGERRLRVALPTYPFERQRFWVEPDTASTASVAGRGEEGSEDWFWVPFWRQALPPVSGLPEGAPEESWLLFADETGFGDRLAARLRERGRPVVVAHAGAELLETDRGDFTLRPGEAADYGALLDRLARRGIVPARIVHLWSAGGPAADSGPELERGFYSLFHLARALGDRRPAESRPPLHLGIVSTGVQRITGADELVPVRATLLGPATTIPQEYPGITCSAIDVTLPPPGSRGERRLIDHLLAELSNPLGESAEPVVAYRGTDRWLRAFEPLSLPSPGGALPLRDGGTYLITGGLGGVGLELAAFLAGRVRAKLVLAGRTPFPEREAWPALARGGGRTARIARRLGELAAAGAEVATVVADVADAASLRRMLGSVRRRFGRIDGVIHAAGLPGGGLMQFRAAEAAAAVLAPKVAGTLLLADLLAADPPDFLVLCSSLNALAGGPGQADYTAANAFLDAFAQARPEALPVLSINWDAWRDVGMADRRPESAMPAAEVGDLAPFPHPLLSGRGTDGEGAGVFVGHLSPGATWVLDEHRLGGHPVVPGTAYLEMAGAAFRGLSGTAGGIELRDVQFVTPLQVGDGETRELQIVLRKNGDGFHHFSARSRDGEGWQEHVIGAVGTAATGEERMELDVASLSSALGWEEEVLGEDYREDLKQAGLGPRWEVLKKIYRRGGELVGLLELAPEFAGDIESFQLHPALLDAATSFAEYHVPGARGNYYLPLSYKRLRMLGPLPSRIYSHARRSAGELQGVETLTFDVAMLDESGIERVRVEEFTLKRVDVAAALRGRAERRVAPSGSALPLAEKLPSLPAERAVEAFGRILSRHGAGHGLPQIAVSVRPLPERLAEARAVTVESLTAAAASAASAASAGGHSRPELETPYVAPRGELEARLAGIWGGVLGLDRVGVYDDFFALGGHSLLGTQMMSRVREAFAVEVPLGKLFEASTVADFAAVVEGLRARTGSAAPALAGAIPRQPRGGELELSFSQERLWFLEQLEPGNAFYSIPGAARLEGPVAVPAFAAALVELVRRHESLRTTFADRDGRPRQLVAPPPTPADLVPLLQIDLSGLVAAAREAALLRLVMDQIRRPFDLVRGPLLRVVLLALAPRDHVVVYILHHIISDGWSGRIFLREIAALYEAGAAGRPSPLPPIALQYADYAAWQRRYLSGAVLEEQLGYWRGRLSGCPVLELPTDRPRPAVETFRGRNQWVELPRETTRALHELSRETGATLFMILLAVFKTLLCRASGQSDLAIGSPIANRGRKDLEGVIGFFANTVVLRTDLSGNPSFRGLLERVREVTLGAYAHEQLPFERLVEELQPARDMSRNPLFQAMCVLQNQPDRAIAVGDLRLSPLSLDPGTAKFDLMIMWEEQDEILHGMVEHNTDLFDATTVARLYRQHEALVAAVFADPGQRLLDLPLFGAAERHQLVIEWNDTTWPLAPSLAGRCVHERVEATVRQRPEAVAARFDGASLSYGELNARANRLAHGLRRRGVGPESLVGVSVGRSLPMVVAALAVLKAGGALVALDPAYPLERLAMIVEDAGLTVLLTDGSMCGHFPAHREIALRLDGAVDPAAGESALDPVSGVGPDHPMYAIYTSGSTGRPKGIVVPHRAFANFLAWQLQASGGEPVRTVQFAAFGFCVSFQEIFSAWCSGGTLVVAGEMTRRDLGAFGAFLAAEEVERLHLPYAALKQLAESSAGLAGSSAVRPSLLREVITAGEPLKVTPSVRQLFAALPGCTLSNQYGASETHVITALSLSGAATEWPELPAVGWAIANVRLHLLDGELRPVPIGVRGEIYAGGACAARCYLNDAVLTASKLVPDPYGRVPGDRLYRTGDLGRRLADGRIESLGRIDGQVKVRGFRVEPGEVEAVLSRQAGVRDAAVVPQGTGEGLRLVAYVVPGPASGPEGDLVESLRRALLRHLPEYMVPSSFVPLAELPVNANGKLDVPALPAPEARRSAVAYRPPRTPVEELVAGLWREILGVEQVGLDDGFFDLGGHSLLATQVVSRARGTFGVELPLRALFEAPTLAGMAQRIERLLPLGELKAAPPLVPLAHSGPLPLSFAQQRLWFLDQLEPGSTAYNLPAAVRLEGALDVSALTRGLLTVVRRHAALRTTFAASGEQPVQVIAAEPRLRLPQIDLGALPSGRREAAARRIAAQEPALPFDLRRGPLFRSALLRLSSRHHIVLFTLHHAIADGWSLGVLVREVAALYDAFVEGRPSPLPELPIQYVDYARWQREWLTGTVLAEQIRYWRERLAGAPLVLELPTDRRRPAMQTFRGATLVSSLPAEVVADLERLARRHGATLFMVLLAAFETLLHRVTGQDCLLVGSTIANRTRGEVENLIGFFVNTLVMRADFPAGLTLSELLARTRESALGAYAHQDLPLEKLVEELEPVRDPSRSPLVQVVMQLQNAPLSRLVLPGLAISSMETPGQTAKFDLGLSLEAAPDGLRGTWEYNTDLLDAATVERLAGWLARLLGGITASAEARVSDLPLLSAAERRQLLGDWSGVVVRPGPDRCLHDLVAEQEMRRPEAVAVVCGGESLSYGELARRTDRLARRLRGLGVGPEVRVGLFHEPSIERVVSLLGTLRAGGAYVPLDPEHPAARLAWIVDSSGMTMALGQESLGAKLVTAGGAAAALPVFSPAGTSQAAAAAPVPGVVLPANLAYVIYTSGSTGRPNGVLVPHRGVAELISVVRERFAIGPASRVAQLSSVTFDASVLEIFLALGSGATLVVARSGERLGEAMAALLAREEVTLLAMTPPLLETLAPKGLALAAIAAGGDRCSAGLARRWSSRLAFYNCCGPTEASIFSVYGRCEAGEEGEPAIGRPVAGTEVYLLDRELQPVPPGSAGELLVGGASLTRGYAGQPERTAERFVPHPFAPSPGARLYRTGDLARFRPDGRLDLLGRIDTQVKLRGVRIEPGEIEAVLAGHGDVEQAAVVAREDLPGGRGLVGFVVARPGSAPTVSALRQHAAARLPEAMLPARLVVVAQLPTTVHGKVDRRALAGWSLDEALEPGSTAPRTLTEELLASLFADLLGRERVGVEDGFFALGGHSLLATRLVSRVREAFGVELPLRELFEAPTVAELAERIDRVTQGAARAVLPAIEPVPRGGDLPLSFAQQRLWILDQLEPGSTTYHLPLAVRLTGELDPLALERSLGEIVRRHEALRTRFAVRDGSPFQVIAPFVPPALPRVDLTALAGGSDGPAGRQQAELRRLIHAEALRTFDLEHGPLFRATLVALARAERSAPAEHALLTTLHHVVSDGWSLGVLLSELTALYAALREGRPSPLPELPVQYADYAVWQRRWLAGPALEREIAYWREALAGVPVLELPADHPRHWARSRLAGTRSLPVLPAGLTAELGRLGREKGATLFMVLLAAFEVLLYRYTGETDIAVGSPIANRTRREIEGLVGFFVNSLVLRTAVSAETGAVELLKRVRETTLAAYSHQDVPFEKLVEELQPERGAHRSPFFQVLLALQNATLPVRQLPGLTLTPLPIPGVGAKFEISVSVAEAEDGSLAGGVEYGRELFDPATIDRLMGHFTNLLAAFVAGPERAVGDLPLFGVAERHQLLAEWNDTRRGLPAPAVVHRLFAAAAARRPEAVAVLSAAGERITYAELDRRAERLARHLLRRGLPLEAPVGVFLGRSPEMVVAFLGILKAGGAYLPLDPAYPVDRLEFLLRDTGAPLVLTREALAGRLAGQAAAVVCLDRFEDDPGGEVGEPAVDGAGLAYVLYTSGSTGRPKGVAVPHLAVVRLVRETEYVKFGPDEVFLQFAPVAFDASTFEIWGALLNGGQVVLAPEGAVALADLGDLVDRHGITTVFLTTALFHLMVDHQLARLSPLRQILTGGELMSPLHVRQALAGLPETRLTIFYGPTENTTFTSYCPLSDPAEVGASVPLGRPIANTRVSVWGADGRLTPVGVTGELCAAGEGLARGYLNRPELTAERFVPDPQGEGGRLYRTGDLARVLPDGRLDFLGRIDHQVKLRGFRIEPGEIEARLLDHPAVREAVVVVHEQPVGNRFLVAYAVGDEIAEPALRDHLRAQLPEYMVPTAFVSLAALPLTPNGKVDRRRLPAPSAERTVGEAAVEAAAAALPAFSDAPLVPVAELLAELWRDLLRIEKVDLADSFFELGGYSLIATALSLRVREMFGVEMSLHRLFDDPTLGGLVAEVEQGLLQDRGAEPPPLVPVDRGGPLPLSFAQERLWILDQIEPGSTAYHVPLALRLTGKLDAVALHRSLGEIVRRHEALRTRFAAQDGSPYQVISPFAPPALPRVDLTGLPGGAAGAVGHREAELLRLLGADTLRPFDLTRGPLFRAALVTLDAAPPAEHALLTNMHHIVSDGWSVGVLLGELAALYGAWRNGRPNPLPELPVQYADFAVWQRRWLSGEVLEREIAYWRETLAGVPVLELPADRPRHRARSAIPGTGSLVVPPGLAAELAQLGREKGVTLFMVLLAAFEALLYRYTGATDVAVGSAVANRTRREIEGLVGFFVNTLVLRTAVSSEVSAIELLKRVRRTTLAAYSHQDVPFEKLVEELQPERGAHRTPFFQVLFALQNAPLPVCRLPGLTLAPLPAPSLGTKFELSLSMVETADGGLEGRVEYRRELFDPTTIDRLLGHFTDLLAALAEGPERPVGDLPLLGVPEWQQVRLPAPAERQEPGRPPSAVAKLLAEIWRDLLRVEEVTLADSFFALGGYSLVATGLAARVREAFGIEISLLRLFEEPTLGGLVAEVEQGLRQDRGTEPPPPLTPLAPVDRGGPLPLSFAQQRLWIIDQLEPGSTAYHVPFALRLAGELDAAALHWSLGEILRRHEALRTRFAARDGSPFQVILPFALPALPRVDLTALAAGPDGRRETELVRLIHAASLRPFDLQQGPLFRATLVVLDDGTHALLTNMHHIVSDGWSVGVLLAELAALYGARRDGRPNPLPELAVQYADYAVWQRRWLAGEVLEREIAYWREALAGVPVLELPTDRPRHWERRGSAGSRSLVLPPRLRTELVQLCREKGATLFMVLLAAFEVLLHRYTGQGGGGGQADVAVGSPIANRTHREIEGLVGFFVNTLVLRTAFPADAALVQVLRRVRETALGAYVHQDVPFEKLVEELQPERGPHRSPFFQVFFILQNAPLPVRQLPGLTLTPLPIPGGGAKFDLTLSLMEAEDGSLQGGIEYGCELFDASTIERMVGHFTHLLAAFAAAPERAIGDIPLLGAAERHQLLAEWNDTRRSLPQPAVVHRLFAEQAALRPEAVAVISAAGERISYGELDRRSDRLARRLLRLGLPPEAPVGVFLERSPETVTAFLAALKAGGAYVPIDPSYPVERLEYMLRDSRAAVVVTQAALAGRLAGLEAAVVEIDRADDTDDDDTGVATTVAVVAANLAYVIYTSGSTGRPKGVCVAHEGIVRLVREGGFATLGTDDVVLHTCPVSFDVATFEIWGALLSGSTLAILPSATPSLDELGEAIARHQVTTLWLTSGLFTLMVNHRLSALRPVRQLLAGGDVVPLAQAQRVLAELPGCRLIDGYGPTENTTFTACHPLWQGLSGRSSVPIGRPIGNTRVAILDAGTEPVPVGVAGELYTGGLGLARGYFDRPELTAERFLPDGISGLSGERLYRTGDRARWLADGTIEFLGRLDHQVKVRGFRIELGEIETALARHKAVVESVVVTREDRPGDRRLVAYVVAAAGLELAPGELAGFLRRSLPEYMVPGAFVTLPAIPLSANSKPDREALPPPPDVTAGTETSYVPPRTRLEERIAAVWREVLGVPRVGVHDNFFSLGGHSLLLLQAVARLREETGRPLTPIELFEYPTVAALAKRLAPEAAPDEAAEGAPVLEQSLHRGASRRQSLRRRSRGEAPPAVQESDER